MKRALSLIIVLAMVLCMIPFSAFAEEVEAGWNTGSNFVDGTVTLNADNDYTASHLWQCGETGTMSLNYTLPEGTEIEEGVICFEVIDNQSEEPLDGPEFSVTEGEYYEIVVYTSSIPVEDVYVFSTFKGLPGTETNPYFIKNPAAAEEGEEVETSVTVPGNSTMVYCNLYGFSGQTVIVEGNGVKVTIDGVSYGSLNDAEGNPVITNTAEFEIDAGTPSAAIQLINKSDAEVTYTFSTKAPVIGTVDNPQVITEPDTYTQEVAAGNQGYYYTYTAEGDGTVKVYVDATYTVKVTTKDENENEVVTEEDRNGWQYVIDKTYYGEIELDGEIISGDFTAYGDYTTSAQEGAANPFVVDVKAGNTLKIMVNTFNPDDEFNAPAGTVTTTIEFVAEGTEEPEGAEAITLPWEVTLTSDGTLDKYYDYTAETDVLVEVTYTGTVALLINGEYNYDYLTYGENTKYINVAAGEVLTINAFAYAEGDFTFGAKIVDSLPAGDGSSYDFPLVIDTILPNGWEFTNNTENAVYYVYNVEKTGTIAGEDTASFWGTHESAVVKGDEHTFCVEPGQTYTMAYAPAAAMIGDAEYSSLNAALNAAVEGDAIVLCADADVYAGIVLPTNVSLDLGAYSLTAPYVVAFAGSEIKGDVASAKIVTSNLVAGNVTIADVEYAWTAGEDGAYTLVEVVPEEPETPPVVDEGEKVATYNGETYTLAKALELAGAAASKQSPQTVTLNTDTTVGYLTIPEYVTLNLAKNVKLTAEYIVGVKGSILNGTRYGNDGHVCIYVPRENLILSAAAVNNANLVPPMWDKANNCYVLANARITDISNRFKVDEENKTIDMAFSSVIGSAAYDAFFKDNGSEDAAVKYIVRLTWANDLGTYQQDYVFKDEIVYKVANGVDGWNAYTFNLSGYDKLMIDKNWSEFSITAMIATDCGIVVPGATYTYNP